MSYCIKCGTKNEDDSEFCKKCGASLTGRIKGDEKDDDCVCSGSKQNPLVPVFWGIVVILIGIWIVISFVIPDSYLPPEMKNFSFWSLVILIVAISVILTGFRILTKK
jgi:uncharacterized membrane protein YvbJ